MIGLRPDIGFTVVKLAQQMANPSNNHYWVGLHLCKYLLATRRYWLVYNGLSNESLVVYSDSDWGQDHKHRKSTTGYFFILAQGITSWLSHKQKSVVLSSTEAKYMALSDCSCQLIWISNLLYKIGFDIPVPHLYGDNLGSLFWSTNLVQEKRSKHIDIWYHYVRDAIEDNKIKPYHIDGARNPADILTKNLGQILFHQFCPLFGLEVLWTLLSIYIVTQWLLLWVRGSVKLDNYCTMYYCSLIYEPCLHKHACFFVSTATLQTSLLLLRSLFPIRLSINICWITW